MKSREVRLAARPAGEPRPSDFAVVEVDVPEPGPGELLVRNEWMSVDPYMRGRMNHVESYVPPFALDAPLEGGAVGEVLASGTDQIASGQWVLHNLGWREHALVSAEHARQVDLKLAPAPAYLGVLGMPGLTAYAGLIEVAGLRDGDAVFISAAAGAVGSVAGQIAKLKGARVVGSAGSEDKVRFLTDELGFDAAFNYRSGPVRELLAKAAPEGIDVYFDNVGGDHLEAAIASMRPHGRVAMCGMISIYNAVDAPAAPRNLVIAIGKRLTLRGFLVFDHFGLMGEFIDEVGGWLRDGKIRYRETVLEGIDQAPDAFIGLLRGENLGKMLVHLG